MGIGVGTVVSGACTLLVNGSVRASAGPAAQLTGNGVTSGSYCVAIFDAGNQLVDATYSVTVTHY
jgi:hypothetical protein